MNLEAVTLALPSHRLDNEDILALIRDQSEQSLTGSLDLVLRRIRLLLHRSGASYRHWLAPGETALGLIAQSVDQALATAGCSKEQLDVLVYVGVDRGFAEPANAYFVAHALGMDTIQCFDVLDACNGWSRTLQLVYALFQSGLYRRALIIAAEFGMWEGGAIY